MKSADIDWGPGWEINGFDYTGVYNLGRRDCVGIVLLPEYGLVDAYSHSGPKVQGGRGVERRVSLLQAVVLVQMTPGEVRDWLLRKEAEGANG